MKVSIQLEWPVAWKGGLFTGSHRAYFDISRLGYIPRQGDTIACDILFYHSKITRAEFENFTRRGLVFTVQSSVLRYERSGPRLYLYTTNNIDYLNSLQKERVPTRELVTY